MGKLSLFGEYLNRTRHWIFHLMGKVKHLLPHFLASVAIFKRGFTGVRPETLRSWPECPCEVSVSLDRQMEGRVGWQLRKKKYVNINGGDRRLGGPQTVLVLSRREETFCFGRESSSDSYHGLSKPSSLYQLSCLFCRP
jgi:hypothetical protein